MLFFNVIMEKDKSRGIKHIKGKAKYKDNTKKNPKYVPPKNKPNLESNWDRYTEEVPSRCEKFLTSSNDFAVLSSLPITAGSHFHHKVDEHAIDGDELFSLNMDFLNKCILTIPMYERIGMSKDYFTEQDIKHMESEANQNLLLFKQTFAKTDDNSVKREVSEDIQPEEVNTINDIVHIIENCVIEDSPVVNNPPIVTITQNKAEDDDLEQWLDDLLDD
ncbi:apoptosis and caspase activation inhibitor [Rhynchophorus ferrugineus]|uniref:apoptosis and caspase activation inhibitor n=1 Tax=Rhynchophorus ferrugineus TaxID=354439 RepID=UPI003FCD63E1